jgi:hypothetical protein
MPWLAMSMFSECRKGEYSEFTSVAKAAPIIDIDPTTRPAIWIYILHCPYAVNTLSSVPPLNPQDCKLTVQREQQPYTATQSVK